MAKLISNLERRHRRVRSRLRGTTSRPRLSVFRSNKYLYVQLIDDNQGVTLAAADTREMVDKKKSPTTIHGRKSQEAFQLGEELGVLAKKKKITEVCFDRGGYRYAGRVRAVAEGARAAGLKF